MILADRWKVPPWEIELLPAATILRYVRLLALEGEIKGDLEGLQPDETMHWEDDE